LHMAEICEVLGCALLGAHSEFDRSGGETSGLVRTRIDSGTPVSYPRGTNACPDPSGMFLRVFSCLQRIDERVLKRITLWAGPGRNVAFGRRIGICSPPPQEPLKQGYKWLSPCHQLPLFPYVSYFYVCMLLKTNGK
jgi:hypothetical protein